MIFGLAMAAAAFSLTVSPALPASYRLEVRLDTAEHKIYASERVVFLNPTTNTLDRICFHLYPNAFRDTSSVFVRKDAHIRQQILSGDKSELKVSNVTLDGAAIDKGSLTERGTLLYLGLPRRLAPGDSVTIGLDFELLVPRYLLRLGFNERGNYLLSHWHPILAGFQNGRLIDNEYYPQSEFFSNFSNYVVRLEIPSDFAVGSTGELRLIEKDSSKAIWEAAADTVIDFAFACGPAFEIHESDTMGIKLRYLLDKKHEKLRGTTDDAAKLTLAYCSNRLFLYPYSVFTLVDFDMGAQGIELPGMVAISFPSGGSGSGGRPVLWFTIAHEVAHEWFYGTVATNEAEEPWLDEGLSTYMATRILDIQDDNLRSMTILGYRIPLNTLDRMLMLVGKAEWPVNLKSWEYSNDFAYSAAVYFRAEAALQTLEQMVGQARFDTALAEYAIRFRFGHPMAVDLKNSFEASLGLNLDSFFAQYISGTARVDYVVRNLEYNSAAGSVSPDSKYLIKVTVGREYEGVLPQKLEVGLRDGTVIDTLWDGSSRTAIVEFAASAPPEFARLGYSDGPYALDENLTNNSMYLKSFGSRLLTFEWDAVFVLEFLLTLLL